MIIVRFKVRCRPERAQEARSVFAAVVAPSRAVEGVVSFDIAQDITDPNALIATEVFEDRAALDRQEALPEVKRVLGLLPELLDGPPEATLYHVSSSMPWGD